MRWHRFVTPVCSIPCSLLVSSAQPEVRKMFISVRNVLTITEVSKGRKGNVKLERPSGVDYLVGREERCVFPALLMPGSVDGGYCRMDNVEHRTFVRRTLGVRSGCTICTSMTMRERATSPSRMKERRRGQGEKFVRISLEDFQWLYSGSEYLLVALLSKQCRTNAARRSKMR